MVDSEGLYRYAIDNIDKITFSDCKLFIGLSARVEAENRIRAFRQKDLAKILHMNPSNISRSLKKFVEMGIIEKDGLEYYFNDKYVLTGTVPEVVFFDAEAKNLYIM